MTADQVQELLGTEPIETEQILQEPLPTEELGELEQTSADADLLSDFPKGSTFQIMRGMLGALNAKRVRSPGNARNMGVTAFRAEMYQGLDESKRTAADRRHGKNKVARASRKTNRRKAKR